MSPICLINVAGIRDHATVSHQTRETAWYGRLFDWVVGVLRARRA
ncbi:MAG: hypothetical protein WCA85_18955 [Paraburkholderia sp.]